MAGSAPAAAPRPRPPAPAAPGRRRALFDAQAETLESLRRVAHTDADTGLPNRRDFLGRLAFELDAPRAAGTGLLLLRVIDADALVRRLGAAAVQRLLSALAELLSAYPSRVTGAFVGRLNDSDFALFLPAAGLAAETAAVLMRTLLASPVAAAGAARIAIGGIDGLRGGPVGDALAAADQALAQAETAGPSCIEIHQADDAREPPRGERAWRVRIDEALHEGRVRLAEHPVLDARGRVLHHTVELQVQLDVAGPFVDARHWLAMAARGQLLPRTDLAALDLALLASSRDGLARAVRFGTPSLLSNGFVGEVQRRLAGAAPVAARTCLEWADEPFPGRGLPRLREAAAAWRRHGVRLGIVQGAAPLLGLPRLVGWGLDHATVSSRLFRGVASDPAVHDFAAHFVQLLHGMGLQVFAEGIDDAGDLSRLWQLGLDGAAGPALERPPG